MSKEVEAATSQGIHREKLRFSVDSSLLSELGERLVAKPSIALAELVKNAYDADATEVRIGFENVQKKGGVITVEDNGEGITYSDLKSKWMRIGTSNKERSPFSNKFQRLRTGRKGIGRFACRMISEKLTLVSVSETNSKKSKAVAVFVWDKIEPGHLVGDFEIDATDEPVPSSTPTGTQLKLESVRSAWLEEDVLVFEKEILGLVNPFPWQTENMPHMTEGVETGLKIIIDASEYPEMQGALKNDILKLSWGKLEGVINESGGAKYVIVVTSSKENLFFESTKNYSTLGPASFTVYLFSYGEMSLEMPGFRLNDLRRLGREQGGVKVFLDNFRVFHYGEPGDDWLKLEFDRSRSITGTPKLLASEAKDLKRPMLSLPANNQLFGAVFLSWKLNPNISITVTRDRLLENTAFNELRDFVRTGIDWLTIKYAAYRAKERKDEESKKAKPNPVAVLNEIDKAIDNNKTNMDSQTASVLQDYVSKAKEAVILQQDETINQISMLRVLASTGTMISVFNHEIGVIIRRSGEMASDLQDFLEYLPEDKQNTYRKNLQNIRRWTGDIKNLSTIIGLMVGKDARSQKLDLSIHKAVETLFAPFEHYFFENNILSINDVAIGSRTPSMYEAELQSVLINLLTNSIKALGEAKNKKICIRTEDTQDGIAILFLDTGSGIVKELPKEKWDKLFDPFVSYSMPSLDFGVGTGLGLTIVRDIVESYGGRVKFVDPPENWSTCVKIEFPIGEN